MADFVTKLGRTRLGKRLWKGLKNTPLRPAIKALVNALKKVEQSRIRNKPEHRRHDQAQRNTLAQFEAKTQANKT